MKKMAICFLVLFMGVFSGCGTAPMIQADQFAIVTPNETIIALGTDIKAVDALKEPGIDAIVFEFIDGKVSSMSIDDGSYGFATEKGVGIGDSAKQVIAAYGTNTDLEEQENVTVLRYQYHNVDGFKEKDALTQQQIASATQTCGIVFTIRGERVSKIYMFCR